MKWGEKHLTSNVEAKSEMWTKALAQRRLRFDHLLQRGTAEPSDDRSLSNRVVRLGFRCDGREAAAFQPVEQRLSEFANSLPVADAIRFLQLIPSGLRVHATPPYAARANDRS